METKKHSGADEAGIFKDIDLTYKNHAKSLGKDVAELTRSERQCALFNHMLSLPYPDVIIKDAMWAEERWKL